MNWRYPRCVHDVVGIYPELPQDVHDHTSTVVHVQAQGSQQRYSERHREASTALQAAQDRANAAQDQVKYLKDIIADKDVQVGRLAQQVKMSQEVTL